MRSWLKDTWLHPAHIARRQMDRALRRLTPSVRGRVLDIGCGNKPHAALIEPHARAYFGVDLPSSRQGTHQLDAVASGLALPFPAAAFDTVISTEVMEHVPDPVRFLAEIARVLAPSGVLILTVPFFERHHEEPHDFFRYTRYGLAALLAADFDLLDIVQRGSFWTVIGYQLATFLRRLGATEAEAGPMRLKFPLGYLLLPVWTAVQLACAALDTTLTDPRYTIGFAVLARRKPQT